MIGFQPIRRIRILIEREDGHVQGWDIGHPDDPAGRTTMELEKPGFPNPADAVAGVGGTFRIHTTGGYRRIIPEAGPATPAIGGGHEAIEDGVQ